MNILFAAIPSIKLNSKSIKEVIVFNLINNPKLEYYNTCNT